MDRRLRGLCGLLLADPDDTLLRLALADRLEELADPRLPDPAALRAWTPPPATWEVWPGDGRLDPACTAGWPPAPDAAGLAAACSALTLWIDRGDAGGRHLRLRLERPPGPAVVELAVGPGTRTRYDLGPAFPYFPDGFGVRLVGDGAVRVQLTLDTAGVAVTLASPREALRRRLRGAFPGSGVSAGETG
jgi:hypothetical protein